MGERLPLLDCCEKAVSSVYAMNPMDCPTCGATLIVRDRQWFRSVAERDPNTEAEIEAKMQELARVSPAAYWKWKAEQAGRALEQEREKVRRAVYIAEHLFQMIDPQTWRDSGGDDGQGHYEGDYHAEQTRVEIEALLPSSAASPEEKT